MKSERFFREGGSPSPDGSAEERNGDGPRPSPGHGDFSASTQKLSGMVSGVLGWTPDQFWNATPAELTIIFSAFADSDPSSHRSIALGIKQLEKLKEIYPDG